MVDLRFVVVNPHPRLFPTPSHPTPTPVEMLTTIKVINISITLPVSTTPLSYSLCAPLSESGLHFPFLAVGVSYVNVLGVLSSINIPVHWVTGVLSRSRAEMQANTFKYVLGISLEGKGWVQRTCFSH